MNPLLHRVGWLFRRDRKEAELDEELRFHLEEEAERLRAEGADEEDARLAARREFGNVMLVKETARVEWTWALWEDLEQDVRYALRGLRANKSFTLLVALSLALGIGANTTIFSFMDSILLRSLPVADPASLAVFKWHSHGRPFSGSGNPRNVSPVHGAHGMSYSDAKLGIVSDIFPYPALEVLHGRDSLFSSFFTYCPAGKDLTLNIRGQADTAAGEYVSGDYFRGLDVAPAAGRLILADDDRAGAPAVTVVSAALSRRYFAAPTEAVGQTIDVNGVPFTVVGVTPAEFYGVDPARAPDLFFPMHASLPVATTRAGIAAGDYLDKNLYWVQVMARLRPGVTPERAQAVLRPQFQTWVAATATNAEAANLPELIVAEGGGGLDALRREYSKPLFVLMTLVGLILAIACANIANLLLARGAARRREMALRMSLGAGRSRLVRQLLTESVLLALVGSVPGIGCAVAGMRLLTVLLAGGDGGFSPHASLNWHVLALAAGLALVCGVLFGLAPALASTRHAGTEARAGHGHSRARAGIREALTIAQIALSLILLVAAALFTRSLSNLQSVDTGFGRENILILELNARQAGRPEEELPAFYENLRQEFSRVPGVRSTTFSNSPLIGEGTWAFTVTVAGTPVTSSSFLVAGPEFFSGMQIPIVAGRALSERDRAGSPSVAVVNERFAREAFGAENPVGRRLTFGGGKGAREMEIVGVSRDVHYGDLKSDPPQTIFFPYSQGAWPVDRMTFEVRTTGNPLAYANTMRAIVRRADPRLPVGSVTTEARQIDSTINQEITFAWLCGAFAGLALAIGCVGLYGVVSWNVARRTSEIGIRVALGAGRGTVVRMVLREVLAVSAAGLAIGIPAAIGGAKLVESFLFGMKALDPRAFVEAAAMLAVAAAIAGYLPSRRAARIDPMTALRYE